MPYTSVFDCPNCDSAELEWETVNWTDQDGQTYQEGIVCKECGSEVELTYDLTDVHLRCRPDGTVV